MYRFVNFFRTIIDIGISRAFLATLLNPLPMIDTTDGFLSVWGVLAALSKWFLAARSDFRAIILVLEFCKTDDRMLRRGFLTAELSTVSSFLFATPATRFASASLAARLVRVIGLAVDCSSLLRLRFTFTSSFSLGFISFLSRVSYILGLISIWEFFRIRWDWIAQERSDRRRNHQ